MRSMGIAPGIRRIAIAVPSRLAAGLQPLHDWWSMKLDAVFLWIMFSFLKEQITEFYTVSVSRMCTGYWIMGRTGQMESDSISCTSFCVLTQYWFSPHLPHLQGLQTPHVEMQLYFTLRHELTLRLQEPVKTWSHVFQHTSLSSDFNRAQLNGHSFQ